MLKTNTKKWIMVFTLTLIAVFCGVMATVSVTANAASSAVDYKNQVTENGQTLLASSSEADNLVTSNITAINPTFNPGLTGYAIKNVESNGSANTTVWKMNFHSSVPTKGLALEFSSPVALTDIESITIRMNAHFSSASPYFVDMGGVMITALETTEVVKGTNAHTILGNVTQDAWIDYTISGSQLNHLVDGNGNINGIQIASHIISGDNSKFYVGTGNEDKSWLLVDYVYYTKYQPTALEKLREKGFLLASAEDGDYELVEKSLIRMNGYDIVPGTTIKGSAGIEVVEDAHKFDAGDTDIAWADISKDMVSSKAFRIPMHSGRTTLFGPAIKFKQEVKAEDIGGLTIRLFAILSNTDTYQTTYGGIQIFGLNADGYDQGYMIPANVTQNEWTELVITPEEAQLLADEDGYIRGIQFAAAFYGGNAALLYPGSPTEGATKKTARLWIEYVSVSKQVEISYKSESESIKDSQGYVGTKIKDAFIPERDGYVFSGWYNQDKIYNFNDLIEGEIELTAKWQEEKEISTAKGLYYSQGDGGAWAKNGQYIYLNEDGTVDFSDVLEDEPIYYGLTSDMNLYAINKDFTVKVYSLGESGYAAVSSEQIKKVTFDYASGEKTVLVKSGETLNNFLPERAGYSLVSWLDNDGESVNVDEFIVTEDVTFNADWAYVEISQTLYPFYYGSYYSTESSEYLTLKENHDAIIKGTSEKSYKYYLLEPGIFVLEDGNIKTEYALYGQRIVASDGKIYQKLNVYIVTFDTKGGSKIQSQTLDGGDYKITKPEDPTKDGFTFSGWVNLDGTEFDFNKVITSSTTVYASWTANQTNTGAGQSGGCGGSLFSSGLIISVPLIVCAAVIVFLKKKGVRN